MLLEPADGPPLRRADRDAVRWLVVDRPARRNAWTFEMAEQLTAELEVATSSPDVGVLVLAGAGGAFSAGIDRAELEAGTDRPSPFPVEALIRCAKPTVACVDGHAFGLGATMAMACDLRVASPRATFAFAMGRLGMTPEWGSSFLLWRQVGWSRALDLYLTARPVGGEEAHRIGLVDRLVPEAELEAATQELAASIAALPADAAVAIKDVMWRALTASDIESARRIELDEFAARADLLRTKPTGQ